jgi:hypothetical protein
VSWNPAGDMEFVLRMICVVRWRSLRRADSSSRGIVLAAMCLNVMEEAHRGGLGPIGHSRLERKRVQFV